MGRIVASVATAALVVAIVTVRVADDGASNAVAITHGDAIFARSCASCHTLSSRDSGADGGDLIEAHLSVADLASFTAVMPTRARLSPADVHAVAEFIHAAATR